MKDFLELLVKDFGLPEFLASYLMLIVYISMALYATLKAVIAAHQSITKRITKKVVQKDLHPYFTHQEVYKYTRYYIPQYFQNITPTEGEELGKVHAAAAKSKLMQEFLKKGILDKSSIKYFIVLADTGMGKTAFLINLYLRYKRKSTSHYDIKLFPLGSSDALINIKRIENKRDTILLLDAFDEDIKAVSDYQSRMLEILNEVKEFRKIIFTCRTQFFPNKAEEPSDTDDITFGDNIRHSIHKLYLSAFDDKDVFKYLFKKYNLNILKLYRAFHLVKKCPSLMFRPMLLTYIDDLIEGRIFYEYPYQMYEVMIDKWTHRESLKPAITRRETGMYTYEEKLLQFSIELSRNLYEDRERRQGYLISIDELKRMLGNRSLGTDFLSLDDSTGRSLLNRNSVGQFKFSHKSILEYFLAKEIFEKPEFLINFDFHGMDATRDFHHEMVTSMLKKQEGKFTLKSDQKPKSLSSISSRQFRDIDTITITKLRNVKAENFAGLNGITKLVFSLEELLPIYIIYTYIELADGDDSTPGPRVIGASEGSMEPYSEVVRDIRQTIPNINSSYIKSLLENSDIDKSFKTRLIAFLDKKYTHRSPIIELDSIRETFTNGRSERALILSGYEQFRKIKRIKKFVPETAMLF